MPPRRSTRSTAGAKGKGKAVDLTLSSDDDDDNHRRNVNSKGKQPEMDADEAFARVLQAEEDAAGRAEASGSRDEGNGSSSAATQQGGRANRANAALQPMGALQEQQSFDVDDPQSVLREYKALFAGETRCQNCRDASGQSTEKEQPQPQPQQHTGAASRPHLALTASSTRDDFLNATTVRCSDCDVEFCRGCGTKFEAGSTTATVDGEEKQEGECCAEARAVAIYELLASLDAVYLKDHLQKPSANGQPAAKRARKKAPPKGNGAGTGYGSGHSGIASAYSYGYGYGGMAPATSNGTGYAYESEDDLYGDGYDSWDEDGGEGSEYNPLMYEDESEFYAAMEQKIKDAKKAKGQAPPLPVPPKKNAGLGAGKKRQNHAGPSPRIPTAEETRDAEQDKIYLAALRTLASLLPQPDSPTAQLFDFLPHASLPALIELSTLPDLLATLLRNDSVPEWQRRSDVYFAMLDVLGLLGGCEATLGCLFGERREKRWSEGIGKWMQGHGEIAWEREGGNVAPATPAAAKGKGKGKGKKRKADVLDEQEAPAAAAGKVIVATPLYALLKKFLVQANAFRRATAASNDFDESEFALIGICGDFATAGERFITTEKVWDERVKQKRLEAEQANGTADGTLEAGGGSSSETATRGKAKGKEREWTDKEYNKACEELAYGAVELDTTKHHYSRDIAASASSRRPHSSFVHLAKELAVLSTSLPPGIWVRHDEERVDVIKCMIAAPEHSPYAGGLFEFDIFLPLQYPQVSPLCWLVTTGGNTVRFNPNLYAEGKVCLSLLGTWSGTPEEMWQPMKSTILQVLLSITSMILGTNFPFYNEPGFGAPRDDERNKIYNKNVSLATARWAILEWCDDKHKNSIWADVIASHFTLRRQQIQSTVREWAKRDARLHAWEPKHNRVAGSHQLEPWGGAGGYVYPYKADGTPKSAKEITAERNKLEQKVPGRDLVKEIDAALDRLGGWKESGWLEKLVR